MSSRNKVKEVGKPSHSEVVEETLIEILVCLAILKHEDASQILLSRDRKFRVFQTRSRANQISTNRFCLISGMPSFLILRKDGIKMK